MRVFRRAVAATAVAGAFAASLLAGAAPASAADQGAQATGYFTGYGSSNLDWVALNWAENDARSRAQIGGFNPYGECSVTSRHVTGSGYSYRATVQLFCFRP